MEPPPLRPVSRPSSSSASPWPGLTHFLKYAPVGVVALYGVFSSYYTVSPESVAVVQRFGKYLDTKNPGLHFKIPFGVDRATIVPIRRQLKLEFGFTTPGPTNSDQASLEPERERDMVTGDLNAASVEWILEYTISTPTQFLFDVRSPGKTLRDLTESVMSETIGDRTVDEVITVGRTEIEADALAKLRTIVESIKLGVRVEQIQLKNVHPPGPVQRSFDEVNRAQQEREQMINEANGEYNRVIPKARGLADQKISAAEGFAVQRVNEAKGDVARFKELLVQYEKAPDITKQRLYLETMSEVIPQLGHKVILDADAKQFLPLMNLQAAPAPQPAPAPAPTNRR
ncbi:MAG: FtsH protease activity modulator HflK [Luteolibacter sp.]